MRVKDFIKMNTGINRVEVVNHTLRIMIRGCE